MNVERYRVKEGEKVDLSNYSTTCDVDLTKKKVKKELPQMIEDMLSYRP